MNPQVGSMEPVEVHFEIMVSDIFRANIWWLLRKWYMATMYVLIVAVLLYMVPTMAMRGFEPSDLRGFIFPFMFLVVIPTSLYWSARSSIRSLHAKQRQHQYRFADDALQFDAGLSKASVDWEAVRRVVEKRHAFYVFLHKSIFHVVPKRGLRSKHDLNELRAILTAKLGNRAIVRSDDIGLEPEQRGV